MKNEQLVEIIFKLGTFDFLSEQKLTDYIIIDDHLFEDCSNWIDKLELVKVKTSELKNWVNSCDIQGYVFVFSEEKEIQILNFLSQYNINSFGIIHHVYPFIRSSLSSINLLYDFIKNSESDKPNEFYILSIPRTGSTLLCSIFETLGIGHPKEHIRPEIITLNKIRKTTNLDFSFLKWFNNSMILDQANHFTGTKLIAHLFRSLLESINQEEKQKLMAKISSGTLFYLYRNNKVLQALSQDRARQTKIFHAFRQDKKKNFQHKEWEYSYERILKSFQSLNKQEKWLSTLIENMGIEPILLQYQENEDNELIWKEKIKNLFSLSLNDKNKITKPFILRDELTKEYAYRFIEDYKENNGREPISFVPKWFR